jgi:ubiquinone/menaquinone biosynthesis C-methylase UbiE
MSVAKQRVDYDKIAHLYDEPGRDYGADPFLRKILADIIPGRLTTCSILDIGCGTGKQQEANHSAFPNIHLVGLDLFRGMLNQARERCQSVDWIQADCTRSPFSNRSFDYVTSQFSYHHVEDKPAMIAQVHRLLKPDGRFVITNLDPWAMKDWIVYQFFPASQRRDFDDFLEREQLIFLLESAGFRGIHVERQTSNSDEPMEKFLEYARQRYRTSQLMVITDREYDQGLSRLEREVGRRPAGARMSSTISIVRITADKPSEMGLST